jgi:Uncharacterized protein conserved in bacteria (DUF2252)
MCVSQACAISKCGTPRVAIVSYLGHGAIFDDAVADFAEAYADQNERDHRALADAVNACELTVEAGAVRQHARSGTPSHLRGSIALASGEGRRT